MSHGVLRGVWTALATPFDSSFQIDWKAFDKLLEQQAKGKVTGVVISGTTGESPTLTVQEKLAMVRKARANLPSSVRVMAGSGGNNTEQSVELSRLCVEAGADSLLIVTPPYNKPSIAGLKLHFEAIAHAVKVPLCLYHVPGRTAQKLTAGQISSLCTIPSIGAIKEASADLGLFSDVREKYSHVMLTGDDITFLPSLSVGGDGVISVLTNIFPAEFVRMMTSFEAGRVKEAQRIHHALAPFINALFCESNPGPLKAALKLRGIAENIVRLPLAPVTSDSFLMIQSALSQTDKDLAALN